ncbi:uncharacterized protein N7458_009348 [Penicillium daleae]|uniref:Uncharacterized protein n=1 Tax=Penicillium daleae TaxID=63821 RepID=A0AAD6BXC2_9EURO|nr:uncharacterized protein N7458_009348 [Penicillium daleae]KAJ5438350.1 hypothetical protein N7458_009348 [Penicillium daleae]
MSGDIETFTASLYGELRRGDASMRDLKTRLVADVKKALVEVIAERPGTAWVDYHGHTKKVAEHGKLYDDATNDEIWFDHDGSETKPGYWKRGTIAYLTATFHVEDV